MKKLLVFLLFLIPFVTGCTTVDNQLKINKDKSAVFTSNLTYQGNLNSSNDKGAAIINENLPKFFDKNYIVDKDISKNVSKVTARKEVKNLIYSDIDLKSVGFETNLESGRFVDVRKNFLVTSYNIDMTYNYKAQVKRITTAQANKKESAGLVPEYYQKYGDLSELERDIEFEQRQNIADNIDSNPVEIDVNDSNKKEDIISIFSIDLPSLASYNNADVVYGNVYTWNISKTKPTSIKLQYVVYSGFAFGVIILLGLAFFIYIARRILRHDSLKRIGSGN